MTIENNIKTIDDLLSSDLYRDNLDFWERAWSAVKNAYTQLPQLSYLPTIPEILNEQKVKSVLDLGCGSGWLSIYLARNGFEVTGLDISFNAIRLGKEWADKEDLDIHFEVGDIADLTYLESSFDAVVGNSIFEHFPYEMTMVTLKKLRKVLVPGGTFIGCFDEVGSGPGEYFKLPDNTHVYTDQARKGMLLRNYSDDELKEFFKGWKLDSITELKKGSRLLVAFS